MDEKNRGLQWSHIEPYCLAAVDAAAGIGCLRYGGVDRALVLRDPAVYQLHHLCRHRPGQHPVLYEYHRCR